MKALVLCGGYATRLYPLTKNKPKALLEVKGKKILDYIVEKIREVQEVEEIFIVTNNKFALEFEQWAEEAEGKTPITVINDATSSEEDRLGAVGDILFTVKEEKIHDNLLVIGGDNLFEYSLKGFVEFFKEKNSSVVAVRDVHDKAAIAGKFGVVELGESEKLVGFEEKPKEPKTSLAATACYIFKAEDLEELEKYLKAGNKPDNSGDFVKYLSNKKQMFGFVFQEKWYDIGSFEELGKAREEFNGK
ncbi:MAG: glucose-1-phosphate thymidylyltransferase [archaeon GW2011_AR10]|nr:MAG: glucose-1-phosphate thymidylyltransferase [archaeon GW2011_AR10]